METWKRKRAKGGTVRLFGARGSGLGASIDEPATWLPLIEGCARRWSRPNERDDVVSDVALALTLHIRAGARVDSLPGLVFVMVRTAVARQRRHHQWLRFVTHAILDLASTVTELEECRPACTSARQAWIEEVRRTLRGHRQRWLFDRVLQGDSGASLAAELGWELKEVHDQLRALAERIRRSCMA